MRCKLVCILLACLLLALPALAEEAETDLPTVLGLKVVEGSTSLYLRSLSQVSKQQAQQLIEELRAFPEVTEVDLRGVTVDRDGQTALMEAYPGIHFRWEVSVGGAYVNGDITELDLDALGIKTSTALSEIRKALACLPKLERVTMFSFINSMDEMERLLKDFPQIHFDWTLHTRPFTKGRTVDWRTDATAFSTMKSVQMTPRYTADGIMKYLQYMPDLLAIDVGHNNVSDLSFLLHWPNLRRLICVDSTKRLTDISPLAELMDLEYVELFLQDITDISPLANHTKLLDLNLCHNDVTDLSPLYSRTSLERLHISYNPHLTAEEVAKLQEALPNCVIETETYQSTGAGWREHPRYFTMYKSFEDQVYYPFEDEEHAD